MTETGTKAALARGPTKVSEPQTFLEQFDRIYDSIARRAFELFEVNGRLVGHDLEDWFNAETEVLHPVKLNMRETESSLLVQAEVPGFTTKNLEILVEPRRLTISGKRETNEERKKGKTVCQEHRSDEIFRVFDLPVEVDSGNVTATLKNGVLELQMPKSVKAKGTRIEVKSV